MDNPSPPEDVIHVWGWFSELFHGEVLTFNEILSWASLTGTSPSPYEARWLRRMSVAWCNEYNKDG